MNKIEQNNITPAQALELIYKVTGSIQLARQDHQMVEKAIQVLAGLLPAENKEN